MARDVVDIEYMQEIEKAVRHLRALMSTRHCAPIMLRLAWQDAATYDTKTRIGGPIGSIRPEEQYSYSADNGLKIALDLCEAVKSKHPVISYPDLYHGLAGGVVAVEVTGGPTIAFMPGGREVFYRTGLSNDDIVALSGGHTLNEDAFFSAVAHKEFSEHGFSPVREANVKKSTILLQSGGTQLLL